MSTVCNAPLVLKPKHGFKQRRGKIGGKEETLPTFVPSPRRPKLDKNSQVVLVEERVAEFLASRIILRGPECLIGVEWVSALPQEALDSRWLMLRSKAAP